MNIDSETNPSLVLLIEQKKRFRDHVRSMSPTEKIRQLELLQKRYYELLKIREANGGRPIPDDWQKWAKAQESLRK